MKLNPEPSKSEAVLILLLTFLVQIVEISRTVGWRARALGTLDNLDNSSYISLAGFIRHWAPAATFTFQHFWGYPYFIAALTGVFGLHSVDASIVLSLISALIVCLLVHQLYGGLVAVALGMVSSTWILLSVVGACEPLFMALLFASFLAARREQWVVAATLGCLATTVRPLGALMPMALLIYLLWSRNWRSTLRVSAVTLGIATAYLIPIHILTGDAFIQLRLYSSDWQTHHFPLAHRGLLSIPLLRLTQSFFYLHGFYHAWAATVLKAFWILVAVVGAVLMWNPRRWHDLPPVETIFACAYTGFLLCYNFDYIALYIQRFIVPALPFILFAVRRWIPRDRRILWPIAALSVGFNAVILIGFKTLFGFKLWGVGLKPWE
jgi:Dolichyl-phosphate-mannose-protein mannosyltransferase